MGLGCFAGFLVIRKTHMDLQDFPTGFLEVFLCDGFVDTVVHDEIFLRVGSCDDLFSEAFAGDVYRHSILFQQIIGYLQYLDRIHYFLIQDSTVPAYDTRAIITDQIVSLGFPFFQFFPENAFFPSCSYDEQVALLPPVFHCTDVGLCDFAVYIEGPIEVGRQHFTRF